MDAPSDMTDSDRWMTYGELGSVRRISRVSAVRLARRMKWSRQKGNDGFARVLVPVAWQEPAGDRTRDNPDDTHEEGPGVAADTTAAIAALEAAVTMLGKQLDHERTRADVAQGRLDDVQGKLADLQAELAAAMEVADRSSSELQAAQIAASEAQADAAELRQAEAARAGQGRLARLRAAWRGQP